MSRTRKSTRGRKSDGDRVYPWTTGNTEVSVEEVRQHLFANDFELPEETLEHLSREIRSRWIEIKNPRLSWAEAERTVNALKETTPKAAALIRDVAGLEANEVGRPLGDELLGDLDYDFNSPKAYNRITWVDVEAWLHFAAENIEAQFEDLGGRAEPGRSFIYSVGKMLREAGIVTPERLRQPVVDLLILLKERWPGIAFPEGTEPTARKDYVRNAFIASGW